MRKFIYFAILASILLALFWFLEQFIFFHTHNYPEVLQNYLNENLTLYRFQLFGKQLFTEKTYQQSFYFLWIAIFLLLIAFSISIFRKKHFFEALEVHLLFFKQLKINIKTILQSHQKSEFYLLGLAILLIVIHQIYMYQYIFVAMDEAFSWLYFASEGFFRSISHYPVPNNHVFYNLCSSFFGLFIPDAILAMRITAMLSFWALLVLLYIFLLHKANFWTAYISIIFVGLGFSQSVFSVQGRGYMLLTLFVFLAFFSLYKFLETEQKGYLQIFTVASVLGFATIPVFLLASVAFYAYVFHQIFIQKKYQKKLAIPFFWSALWIAGSVWLFYTPILVFSGKDALLGNENVAPKDYDAHWFYTYIFPIAIRESVIYVLSLPKYIAFLLALLLFVWGQWFYWKNKEKSHFFKSFWLFFVIAVVVALLITLVMRAFPFYRVWTYFSILLAMLLGFLFNFFVRKNQNIIAIFVLVFVFAGSFPQFWREIQDFYDPKAYKHHKNLENQTKQLLEQNKIIELSEEAFYIHFWVKYWHQTSLLAQNSCQADVSVREIPEAQPACQEKYKDIWFLRFYTSTKN